MLQTIFCSPSTSSTKNMKNMKTNTKNCPPLPLPSPRGATQTTLVISITSAEHISTGICWSVVRARGPKTQNSPLTNYSFVVGDQVFCRRAAAYVPLSLPLSYDGAASSGALAQSFEAPNIFVTTIPVSCGKLKLITTGQPVECPPGCSPDKVVFHFRVQRCLIILRMRACLFLQSLPAPSWEVLEYILRSPFFK